MTETGENKPKIYARTVTCCLDSHSGLSVASSSYRGRAVKPAKSIACANKKPYIVAARAKHA
jgi:hypothetical protein